MQSAYEGLVGVAVSTTDSESVDRGSNPRRAWLMKPESLSRYVHLFLTLYQLRL